MATGTVRLTIMNGGFSGTRGPLGSDTTDPNYEEVLGPFENFVPDTGAIPLNAVITRIEHASNAHVETDPTVYTIPEPVVWAGWPPTLAGTAYNFTGGTPQWTAFANPIATGAMDSTQHNGGTVIGFAYEINKIYAKPGPFSGYGAGTAIPRAAFFGTTFGYTVTFANSRVFGVFSTIPNRAKSVAITTVWVEVDWETVGPPIWATPPPQTTIPTPTPPTPCPCPSVANPCPCLPPSNGGPGAAGLPGTPGKPGGPGGPGGGGGSSSSPSGGTSAPPGTGPIGGGGGGGSGNTPGGVGWNASICTNTGGAPMAYATVLPSEVFLPGQESQFWFEIAQPS